MIQLQFTTVANDPRGRSAHFLSELAALINGGPAGTLALCLGSTRVSDLEGISAAGSDAGARRLTPAIDAEALVLGYPLSANEVPVSPKGIVSPVVLTRAMLELVRCNLQIFDCGCFHAPQIEHHQIGNLVAECPDTGAAMPLAVVQALFEKGRRAGRNFGASVPYLVIGECVPGGTTTALGVLTALGIDAGKLVSSSMPRADQKLRNALIRTGLEKAELPRDSRERALRIIAAVGDPMQAFVCGLALESSNSVPVVLAGGTQMLAVYALMTEIAGREVLERNRLAVITTKWVAFDQSADSVRLAELVDAPYIASCPDFFQSRQPGLQAYEAGNVKEGVAAGAMMALAHLAGRTEVEILQAVDRQYDLMVLERKPH